jgi:CelD/BcsL family acetyltransferase involved in cellulose biosynthesis
MDVTVADSPRQFEALREPWTRLAETATQASIFTTWPWQWLWWRHYGAGQALRIVVVKDGNDVVAIAPFYVQAAASFPGARTEVLRFIGTGGDTAPDYLDALIRPGDEARVAPALAQFLVDSLDGWDVARITDMPAESPLRSALSRVLSRARLGWEAGVSARISYINLPPTFEEYLGTLGRDRRYTVRNTRRKAEQQPGARFFLWDDAATIDRAVARLAELHHLRWEQKGEAHAFSSPAYVGFHRDVMQACRERDWLRLYCLEVQGAVVAMYYFYRFRGTAYYFQGGFDPQFERLRPGLCLMGYAIEQAIREGDRVVDMLRGEYEFKRQWAKETRETHQLVAYRSNPRALAFRWRHSVVPRVKGRIKRALAARAAVGGRAPAVGQA